MTQKLPPQGTEVLTPADIAEANAARREALDRAREVERDRLEQAVQSMPESMRERLTAMALEQIREGLPEHMARKVTAESASVRALVRVLYKKQEQIEMGARAS